MKGYEREPAFDLRPVSLPLVAGLFREFHPYASTGTVCVYAFAVFEEWRPVAAFLWQPPAPGAARSVSPACPQGVLALSRMVACPRTDRRLQHISKPLRRQMLRMIDRTRWPVLVTYSDESCGHTGHVYQCSGWRKTVRNQARTVTVDGSRVSTYCAGKTIKHADSIEGWAWIQRWEHWIDPAPKTVFDRAWERVAIPGKTWRSGAQAYTYRERTP